MKPNELSTTKTVLIFKTNIKHQNDVDVVTPLLNQTHGIHQWNVATDDIDKVLRIETFQLQAHEIINLINSAGYHCEEFLY